MKKLLFRMSNIFLVSLVALMISIFALPCMSVQAQDSTVECWAVFIGISSYQNSAYCQDLYYSDDDARAFSEALSAAWGSSHMKLIIDSEATKSNILDAIDWLAENAGEEDLVVFSYSGHGGPGGYLTTYYSLPYNYDNDINTTELADALDPIRAGKTVIILENCYAGAFQTKLAKPGRVILMGSRADESGYVYYALEHFVYGYFILQAFEYFNGDNSEDVDTNNDYELSAEEIGQYAGPLTIEFEQDMGNPAVQHPVLYDGYLGELALLAKFVFTLDNPLPSGKVILTVDGVDYTSVPDCFLWIPGSVHEIIIPQIVDKDAGTRYYFTAWSDGDISLTRIIAKGAYSPNYDKQHLLKILSAYGELQGDGWHKSGSHADFSVTPFIELTDTRHIFTGWSGDFTGTSSSGSVVMNAAKTITANWRNEYLLTINSEYGQPTGAGWYNEKELADVYIEPIQGVIIRQIFDGWTGDLTDTAVSSDVFMNSPKVIVATWHVDYTQLYILVFGLVAFGGAVAATVIIIRINRKKSFTL